MLILDDCQERELVYTLRRIRAMAQICSETTNVTPGKVLVDKYKYFRNDGYHISGLNYFDAYAFKLGSGKFCVKQAQEYANEALNIIKKGRNNK